MGGGLKNQLGGLKVDARARRGSGLSTPLTIPLLLYRRISLFTLFLHRSERPSLLAAFLSSVLVRGPVSAWFLSGGGGGEAWCDRQRG